MPEAQVEMGINANSRRILLEESNGQLAQALKDAALGGGSPEEMAERLARLVEERGLVAKAYTHHDLMHGEPADSFAVLFRNSHYPGRAWGPLSRWGVEVRFGEGDLVSFPTGTNHESTYWYDRHVAMIFLGAAVVPGTWDVPVYTVDFAPTLAGLAGIPIPEDLDGRRLRVQTARVAPPVNAMEGAESTVNADDDRTELSALRTESSPYSRDGPSLADR